MGDVMIERAEGRVERPLNSLAELQLSGATLDSIAFRIGEAGVATLSGWHACAASIAAGDRIATFGATDPDVNSVDQHQYDTMKGPCVDAMRGGRMTYYDGTNDEPRWRQFAQAAADADVYSVVSFPLTLDGDVLGALNFYSKEREALREGQREEGQLFAAQAAVAIANTKAYSDKAAQVEQLEEALKTRTLIGQATGLLMGQEGLTSEEAFQKLVQVSQKSNVKLRDIAHRYVEVWERRGDNRAST
jgi:GAF domain-containing protein